MRRATAGACSRAAQMLQCDAAAERRRPPGAPALAENLEQLREKQQAIVTADEQLQQQGREEREHVANLRTELERLTAQESRLPPEHARLTQQLSQSRALVAKAEENVETVQSAKEHKLGELSRGDCLGSGPRLRPIVIDCRGSGARLRSIAVGVEPDGAQSGSDGGLMVADERRFAGIQLYQQRLGLQFDKVGDDRLRLTFTMLDPNRAERAFWLEVRVTAGDRYVAEQCEPPVADLPMLTEQLNASNDFSAFVRTMRHRFKALV